MRTLTVILVALTLCPGLGATVIPPIPQNYVPHTPRELQRLCHGPVDTDRICPPFH